MVLSGWVKYIMVRNGVLSKDKEISCTEVTCDSLEHAGPVLESKVNLKIMF